MLVDDFDEPADVAEIVLEEEVEEFEDYAIIRMRWIRGVFGARAKAGLVSTEWETFSVVTANLSH